MAVWPVGWKTDPAYSFTVDCLGNCRQIILPFWASALSIKQNNGTNLQHELVYESLVFSRGIGNFLLKDESLDLNFPAFGTVRMWCLEFQNTAIWRPCCVDADQVRLVGVHEEWACCLQATQFFSGFWWAPKNASCLCQIWDHSYCSLSSPDHIGGLQSDDVQSGLFEFISR